MFFSEEIRIFDILTKNKFILNKFNYRLYKKLQFYELSIQLKYKQFLSTYK